MFDQNPFQISTWSIVKADLMWGCLTEGTLQSYNRVQIFSLTRIARTNTRNAPSTTEANKNICSCSNCLKNSIFPVLCRGMEIIWRSVAPESGSAAIIMNVPDGKSSTWIDVRYIQVFSDLHTSSIFGIGKDPSREPSGREKTSTIICSGGLLNETYPFQVTESVRVAFWIGEGFEISKRSDGWTGGVDAIQTMGKQRRNSPASAMIHCNLPQTSEPVKNAIFLRGL